jgi:Acetyltransferase (GNAT) domain
MKSPFRVATRKDVGAKEWDALADASDEAWLWHRYDLQDALATWRGVTDDSFALIDADENRALALVPLRRVTRRAAGIVPVYILECFGGVALCNGLGEKRRRAVLHATRDQLLACASRGFCLEVRASLCGLAPALRGANSPRVNPLLEIGCANTLTQTWVVDMRGGREAVWTKMEGRARTAVRKAKKAGVTVREARHDDLETYYHLHLETYRRTGVTPHPKDYFRAIWDHFLVNGLARVWIAEVDGQPVAAQNFGVYKQAAIYWSGAANAKGLEAGANSLLQWTAMQWMLNGGVQWYEPGEAFPQFNHGKQKGLNDFKKSFGGSLYPYYKGQLRTGRFFERLYQIKKNI